jgi:preprotein translocase subunit SecB
MQDSPLELLFYYVESLRWKVESGYDPETAASVQASDIEWHLQRNDDEEGGPRKAAYRLQLALPSQDNRFPYSFEIVLIGFFQLNDSVPEESVSKVLDANAPAVLYGAAREALATSVGRGPFRPLILPSVHFLGMKREKKAIKKPATAKPRRKTASKTTSTPKSKSPKKPAKK